MAQFNTSEGMKGFIKNLIKPKSGKDMSDVNEALTKGLGRKNSQYKSLKQEIGIKKIFNDGNTMVLMDDSKWDARKGGGWNQDHAKYWSSDKQTVVVSAWDSATDSYLIENSAHDKSYWTFQGYEGDESR